MVDKVVDVAWLPQEMSNASEGKNGNQILKRHLHSCEAKFECYGPKVACNR